MRLDKLWKWNHGTGVPTGIMLGGLFGFSFPRFSLKAGLWVLLYPVVYLHEFIVFGLGICLGICLGIAIGSFKKAKADVSKKTAALINREILLKGAIALFLAMGIGACILLGFSGGLYTLYQASGLPQIEDRFPLVKSGMTSGEALKTIFEEAVVFPAPAGSGIEKWAIWGYDIEKMILGRFWGSSPFTLTIDTKTDRVIKAQHEYNSRFD